MPTLTRGKIREAASRVLDCVRLVDVHLAHQTVEGAHPIVEGPFEVRTNVSFESLARDSEIDVFVRFNLDASAPSDVPAWRVVAELVATWEIRQAPELPFSPDDLTSFALAVGIMAIYPFGREAIQSLVGRLGYPPFTLDMLPSLVDGDPAETLNLEKSTGFHYGRLD